MSKESKTLEKAAQTRQPFTARRVADLLLNNALIIIMVVAVVYIAIVNPNFVKPASLVNILAQTCAYLPVALGVGGWLLIDNGMSARNIMIIFDAALVIADLVLLRYLNGAGAKRFASLS